MLNNDYFQKPSSVNIDDTFSWGYTSQNDGKNKEQELLFLSSNNDGEKISISLEVFGVLPTFLCKVDSKCKIIKVIILSLSASNVPHL